MTERQMTDNTVDDTKQEPRVPFLILAQTEAVYGRFVYITSEDSKKTFMLYASDFSEGFRKEQLHLLVRELVYKCRSKQAVYTNTFKTWILLSPRETCSKRERFKAAALSPRGFVQRSNFLTPPQTNQPKPSTGLVMCETLLVPELLSTLMLPETWWTSIHPYMLCLGTVYCVTLCFCCEVQRETVRPPSELLDVSCYCASLAFK